MNFRVVQEGCFPKYYRDSDSIMGTVGGSMYFGCKKREPRALQADSDYGIGSSTYFEIVPGGF